MKNKLKFSLGKKITLLIIILAVILSSASIVISYNIFSREMTKYYTTMGNNVVKTMASQLDADKLTGYYKDKNMDEYYYETQKFIREMVNNNDLEYMYVVRPEGKGVTFIFDSDMEMSQSGTYSEGGYCALGTYVELVGKFAENAENLNKGKEIAPIIQFDESYGWLMTAMTPVKSDEGILAGYVMADIDMNNIVATKRTFFITLSGVLFVLTAIFTYFALQIMKKKLVEPVEKLTSAASAFIIDNDEELSKGIAEINVPDIKTNDEIEVLAHSFLKMEEDMISYIHDFIDVTTEKERISAELNVAAQIQASMLPCIFPAFPDRSDFDIFASMTPAKEVGGDFYDFFMVDESHLAVVIADVSGKGVPASLFMAIGKTLIKDHGQTGASPDKVFIDVNNRLCAANSEGLFITAFMGVLNLKDGTFVYTNAGHNPPLLYRKDEGYSYIKIAPGFVLAGMEDMQYKSGSFKLMPGDRMFFYTDGVTEATDKDENLFGEERLLNVLNANKNSTNRELLASVDGALKEFVKEAPQYDDITMMSLTLKHFL